MRHGIDFGGELPPRLQGPLDAILATEPPTPDAIPPDEPTRPGERFGLRALFRHHRGAMVIAVALVIAETLLLQAGPLLVQLAIDRGVLARDRTALSVLAVLFILSALGSHIAMSSRLRWTGQLGQRLMYSLRLRVFRHLHRLSLDYYTRERAGRVLTRMTSDLDALTELLQDGIVNLIVQGLTLVVVMSVLFAMNAHLALVVVVAVLPATTFMTLWFRSASERRYGEVRDRIADVLADLQENLAGIRIVQSLNRRDRNADHHRLTVEAHKDAGVSAARVQAIYGSNVEAIGVLGQALILIVGAPMLFRGELTVGELTAFILYLAAFFAPIQQLVQLYSQYQSGQAALTKIADLLATAPSVDDARGAIELPPVQGEVHLQSVSFGYDGKDLVLRDVDLLVRPGETVALVGPTGAGKSTVAKLIPRFYDVTSGRVLIDGHDVRDVTQASLRHQIGVVPQETYLFSGSLRDNVALGRPDASDDEVLEICAKVGLDSLISGLAEGIHTPVAERGSTLSAGERQLVALARALLVQPRVLVLDEATSNLDLASEVVVDRALDTALHGRTAIVIAHRLSTAARADRIVVLVNGRIVEVGPHAELIARGGVYAEMHATWSQHLAGAHG